MDDLDRRLLNLIQEHFPIDERPYLQLAKQLGTKENRIIDRINSLVERGIIRHISPVFDLRRLGYRSTLAALNVPEDRIDEVAAIVNRYEEVTHNYLREGEPNMWFTLIAESGEALARVLAEIEREANCGPLLNLPAERQFRTRVVFDFDEADDD
ncbi:MAG: siroheme decarboxylase subunit alpha [Candidatus Zipacnadales bacterium]